MARWVVLLLAAGWSLAALGCRRQSGAATPVPAVGFETGEAQIVSTTDTFVVRVEIAETPQQRGVGLMRRLELPESAGMIFLFQKEQPRGRSFWMHRTSIPLSIAFLDADGVIRQILDMDPCRSRFWFRCPGYPAAVPFHAALEVNRGYFGRRGVTVGDRLVLRRNR